MRRSSRTDRADLLSKLVDQFERDTLQRYLRAADGNVSEAAQALGISRVALDRKLERHGLREFVHGLRAGRSR